MKHNDMGIHGIVTNDFPTDLGNFIEIDDLLNTCKDQGTKTKTPKI